jgi:hypothetical protein
MCVSIGPRAGKVFWVSRRTNEHTFKCVDENTRSPSLGRGDIPPDFPLLCSNLLSLLLHHLRLSFLYNSCGFMKYMGNFDLHGPRSYRSARAAYIPSNDRLSPHRTCMLISTSIFSSCYQLLCLRYRSNVRLLCLVVVLAHHTYNTVLSHSTAYDIRTVYYHQSITALTLNRLNIKIERLQSERNRRSERW